MRGGVFEGRITIKGRVRRSFKLPHCYTELKAEARTAVLAGLAQRLRRAGIVETTDAERLLEFAAAAPTPKVLQSTLEAAELLIGGDVEETSNAVTWGEVADDWVEGRLHKNHPDHVRALGAPEANRSRVKLLKDSIGAVPVASFTLEHAEHAMSKLPDGLETATRRHYAQVIRRVLALSVYPLKLREANPIPVGFMPKQKTRRAMQWLYPKSEARLMACEAVPLHWRVLWAFLYREGLRVSEALALRVQDVDLAAGVLTLDKNKTGDPRAWALGADVRQALELWLGMRGKRAGLLFVDDKGRPLDTEHLADIHREHLTAAGVKDHQPELFVSTEHRKPVRAHDLRAAFVTLSLAAGKSESWIGDRTGHRSSQMIARYKRQARTAAELQFGTAASMVDGIPELAAIVAKQRQAEGANTPRLPQRVAATDERPSDPSNEKTAPIGAVLGSAKVARPAGFEPATSGLEIHRSIQLSYGRFGRRGL